MLKIAIVGTGIIGLSHIKAIKQLSCCKLCALCDLNEEKVKALAAENKTAGARKGNLSSSIKSKEKELEAIQQQMKALE